MAYSNKMTDLIDKLERRLGTKALNLPEDLQKDKWVKIIISDTLTTFSRYFPNVFRYEVNTVRDKGRGDFCLIDENLIPGDVEILGIRDLAWDDFTAASKPISSQPYGIYDFFSNAYSLDDTAMVQMRADQVSLFDNGIYPEFEYPNKLRLKSVTGANMLNAFPTFKVDLLVKHSPNLNTIAPTKMEILEKLALADVAVFLYESLKYYEDLETVFANVTLKLADLEDKARSREDIVTKLEENYVSAANTNQPMLFTV